MVEPAIEHLEPSPDLRSPAVDILEDAQGTGPAAAPVPGRQATVGVGLSVHDEGPGSTVMIPKCDLNLALPDIRCLAFRHLLKRRLSRNRLALCSHRDLESQLRPAAAAPLLQADQMQWRTSRLQPLLRLPLAQR